MGFVYPETIAGQPGRRRRGIGNESRLDGRSSGMQEGIRAGRIAAGAGTAVALGAAEEERVRAYNWKIPIILFMFAGAASIAAGVWNNQLYHLVLGAICGFVAALAAQAAGR